jgi:hypothetical protein
MFHQAVYLQKINPLIDEQQNSEVLIVRQKKKHPEDSGCVALNYRYKNS